MLSGEFIFCAGIPLFADRETRQVDGNQGQVNRHDVNRQGRQDEERRGPHAPVTVRPLPVRNRVVMVRWRMGSFVRVMMVLDFSHLVPFPSAKSDTILATMSCTLS